MHYRVLSSYGLVALFAAEERTDGDKDNEEGDNECPNVGDTRGGGDSVAAWNRKIVCVFIIFFQKKRIFAPN